MSWHRLSGCCVGTGGCAVAASRTAPLPITKPIERAVLEMIQPQRSGECPVSATLVVQALLIGVDWIDRDTRTRLVETDRKSCPCAAVYRRFDGPQQSCGR